jgi:hypothetical protein
LNQTEQAIKIFTHLRPDPVLGPNASLFAGTIHMNQHQFAKAIMDFEIGLKHENLKLEVGVELKYRLAMAYLKQQEIGRSLTFSGDPERLSELQDVPILSPSTKSSTRTRTCRYSSWPPPATSSPSAARWRSRTSPRQGQDRGYLDQQERMGRHPAEVETRKWSDVVLFRFIRTSGTVGELTLRDFHSRIKEVKAGKGYCLTTGGFSDEAKKFVEARLIDLIEKDRIGKILDSVDASVTSLPID